MNKEADMKDKSPHDPINMIGEAYELLLEKTMHNLHLNNTASVSVPVDSKPHAQSHQTKTHGSDWLESGKEFFKLSALELLGGAGDKTRLELKRLANSHKTKDWHFGKAH